MKAYLLALISAMIAVATTTANAEVHVLNDNNFESFVKSQDYTLVKFYAPWCGHCKNLAPHYVAASEKLTPKIAEVDCTLYDSKALCEKYGVRGYPTLKGFSKDLSSVDYDDGRTEDAIVAHVLAATSPAVTYVNSADELESFKKGPLDLKLVVNTSADSALAKTIESAAKTLRKAAAIAIDTTKTDDKVTLYRTFDEPQVVYDGAVTASALSQFVGANSLPLIGEIGPHNYKKYVDRNVPLVWIFIDYQDAEQVAALETFKSAAKEFSTKLAFAKLDGNKWAQHAKSFGLESATPGIVIEDRTSRKKFAYPAGSKLTATDFEAFLKSFEAKTLQPIFKSEPIPADNTAPVTILVGKNFDQVVLDNDKDVFVLHHGSFCGHCKAMMPAYDTLGEQFKDDSNIVIGKIEATANDSNTPYEVSGFPTMYFWPKGDKTSPIRYNGDRTAEAMAEFINTNRKSEVGTAKKSHSEL